MSVSANGLKTLITVGVGMVTTPLLVQLLGPERYGTFRALTDLSAYLALLDLGLGGAVLASLGRAFGAGDKDGAGRTIHAAYALYRPILLFVAAGIAVMVIAAPLLLGSGPATGAEIRYAALILGTGTLALPLSMYQYVLEATQRSYLVHVTLLGQSLVATACLVLTAWFGWGLAGQSAATAGTQVAACFLFWLLARGCVPKVRGPVDDGLRGDLWKLNWHTFVFQFGGRLSLLSDNLVIGGCLGQAAIAPFFITTRLASLVQLQLQGIGNASWAGLVELHMRGEHQVFAARLAELTRIVSGVGIAVLVPVATLNSKFIALWVGPGMFGGASLNALGCVSTWLWALFSLWFWPINGAAGVARLSRYMIVFTAVNISLSLGLTLLFGNVGPVVGTIAAYLAVFSWAVPRVFREMFGVSAWSLWGPVVAQLRWGIPYAAGASLVTFAPAGGWAQLLLQGAALTTVGLGLWWTAGLRPEGRTIWIARLRSMHSRVRPAAA